MKKITLILSVLSLVLSSAALYLLLAPGKNEIVYVDTFRLYNEFKFKKELESQADLKFRPQQAIMDSLEHQVKRSPENADLAAHYQQYSNTLRAEYDAVRKEIQDKVWDRLNNMLKDYGKRQKKKIVIGANGMGTVLYGDEAGDVTTEVIEFVNDRYENGN